MWWSAFRQTEVLRYTNICIWSNVGAYMVIRGTATTLDAYKHTFRHLHEAADH